MNVRYKGGDPTEIAPQNRMFPAAQTQTSEAALLTRWNGQLYVVLGDANPDGRWQVRIWWKPFVMLIWYGGILIALGGLLSVLGRLRRGRVLREQTRYPAAA